MISIKWTDIQETDCSTDIYTFHFAKKIELYILRLSSFMGNTKYFKVIIHFRKKICVGIYFQVFNDKSENKN